MGNNQSDVYRQRAEGSDEETEQFYTPGQDDVNNQFSLHSSTTSGLETSRHAAINTDSSFPCSFSSDCDRQATVLKSIRDQIQYSPRPSTDGPIRDQIQYSPRPSTDGNSPDFQQHLSPIAIEEIDLEETQSHIWDATDDNEDGNSSAPIIEEPDDSDNDEIAMATTPLHQADNRPVYDWSRNNNVQVINLIDDLIQKSLLTRQEVGIEEADGNTIIRSSKKVKKKQKSDKKPILKASKSAYGCHGDAARLTEQDTVAKVTQQNKDNKAVAWEIDCTDFAPASAKVKKQSSSTGGPKRNQSKASIWMITKDGYEDYVPPVVMATPDELAQRKVLDHRRWLCTSRPQYSKSCGLSSLVGCWNYLYSTLGAGNHQPITQEQALTVLGFKPPFTEIRFGPFTGNATLMRWFKQLNNHYGTRGRSYLMYKPVGKNKTDGRSDDAALRQLKTGLQDESITYIYHCLNHYFCPIGFEDVPLKAVDAYRRCLTQEEVETWVLIGDSSRKHPGIHCFKWEDIAADLNCQMPQCINIRKLHMGVQTRKTKKVGGNLHCIMAFQKSNWQGVNKSAQKTTLSKGKKGGKEIKSSTQTTYTGFSQAGVMGPPSTIMTRNPVRNDEDSLLDRPNPVRNDEDSLLHRPSSEGDSDVTRSGISVVLPRFDDDDEESELSSED